MPAFAGRLQGWRGSHGRTSNQLNSPRLHPIPSSAMVSSSPAAPLPHPALARLAMFVDRLRPPDARNYAEAAHRVRSETARLTAHPEELALLRADVVSLLALENQNLFYADTGVQSTLGFFLELSQRISYRLLPRVIGTTQLGDALETIFHDGDDPVWVDALPEGDCVKLLEAIGLAHAEPATRWLAALTLLNAARVLSYQIAAAGLDREVLRNEPALDRYESPFLAQNVEFMVLFDAACRNGVLPDFDETRHLDVLLDQCSTVIQRVRRLARENGTSIRLTYLLERLEQLIRRLRALFDVLFGENPNLEAVRLFKTLLSGLGRRDELRNFIAQNINLLARNITENASQHGEHYIADNRTEWFGMFRAAAGGGIIIAGMAALKLQLGSLHLPPLTEGFIFGLNYAFGFSLIHVLGLVVATKQPAMTATTLAAEFEGFRPREIDRLAALVRDVVSTQQIAILGNVLLAAPLGFLIAWGWPHVFGTAMVGQAKASSLLSDLHPFASGALGFAAVAGVGLFLSGLVSGYYDNRARYQGLAARIAQHPALRVLGSTRRAQVAAYVGHHYGAIAGNVFFGFYLGLVGNLGHLTGLPIDIRHVAFSSANVGTAMALLDPATIWRTIPWAVFGVLSIGAVNLAVSFSLALYVAMRSRQQALDLLPAVAARVLSRYMRRPWTLMLPPQRLPAGCEAADANESVSRS